MRLIKEYYIIFSLIATIITSSTVNAQQEYKGTNVYFSPRITLGYTFGAGFDYGFDAVLGIYQINTLKCGLDFTWYMVNTDQGHHRIKGIGLMAENDYLNIKLGAGMVSRRWGLKNVNKAKSPGIMIDVSGSVDAYKAPWIGAKGFIINREKWTFYDQPSYISAFTYFKSQDIEIFNDKKTTTGQ